ncbi:MAG: hypothetical protein KY434_10950, partial [Actinobacteria bacterium]|nr:hypothetical protein [Actinomycetota bacterium]
HVTPDRKSEREAAPRVEVVDRSRRPADRRARLAQATTRAISAVVGDGGVVVVLAARAGQGAALVCSGCGQRRTCPRCTATVAAHRDGDGWRCPSCGDDIAPSPCPECGDARTAPLAAGAGRLAQELRRSYPDAAVTRMEGFAAEGPSARPALAVMTRGSVLDRPAWLGGRPADLLVLPDADAWLARPYLQAREDALRLWLAAGRQAQRVVLQTHDPPDPTIQAFVRWDPDGWWQREAQARAPLSFPPAGHLIAITAPAAPGSQAEHLAEELREARLGAVMGPDASGRVLVKTADLRGTLEALAPLRRRWGHDGARVRVDVDCDP